MNAPGKAFRKGITLIELMLMFPDDETAERWFIETRWPDGIRCPHCDSERAGAKGNHPNQPYDCSDCRSFFSVKTNSVMHASKVGYQKWAMAIYLMTTNLQGRLVHETPPRHRRHAKDRVVHGAPHPRGLGDRRRDFRRTRGGGRDLYRRQGIEQA